MQLKPFNNVSKALSAAACALLGGGAAQAKAGEAWDVDTALMLYSETDRVQTAEGIVQLSHDFGDEHVFSGKLVLDTLTGASANGAVPQPSVQTFTRPSGGGQYSVSAGDTPLDDTFKDTRVQANGQWTQPLSQNFTISAGLHFSNEHDYQSFAFNGSLARDFNHSNTTLSLGLSQAMDVSSPEGGRPVALSAMVVNNGQFGSNGAYQRAIDATRLEGEGSRDTTDLILGLTQVMSRNWITQFNVGLSEVSGYLNDPYKIVSVVDGEGSAVSQLYESRPDTRSKQFVYLQSKYHLRKSIADISFRFTTDDWGLDSQQLELRYRMPFGAHSYVQPHLRFYQQSAVDFYHRFLSAEDSLPDYASADYRIGEMTATTVGLKFGHVLAGGNEFSLRLEYYQQQSSGQASTLSALQGLELYPTVDAFILQFGYRF